MASFLLLMPSSSNDELWFPSLKAKKKGEEKCKESKGGKLGKTTHSLTTKMFCEKREREEKKEELCNFLFFFVSVPILFWFKQLWVFYQCLFTLTALCPPTMLVSFHSHYFCWSSFDLLLFFILRMISLNQSNKWSLNCWWFWLTQKHVYLTSRPCWCDALNLHVVLVEKVQNTSVKSLEATKKKREGRPSLSSNIGVKEWATLHPPTAAPRLFCLFFPFVSPSPHAMYHSLMSMFFPLIVHKTPSTDETQSLVSCLQPSLSFTFPF